MAKWLMYYECDTGLDFYEVNAIDLRDAMNFLKEALLDELTDWFIGLLERNEEFEVVLGNEEVAKEKISKYSDYTIVKVHKAILIRDKKNPEKCYVYYALVEAK